MSTDEYDASFIQEALPAFIGEAQEHLVLLEDLLLQLEHDQHNRELLDALFRSAHTIKGSAGIFGINEIVGFTHHMETLLEHLRQGRQALTSELGTLLLSCADHVKLLLEAAASPQALATIAKGADGERLVAALCQAYADSEADSAGDTETPTPEPAPDATIAIERWQLSATYGADVFRDGMDPVAIISYLQSSGAEIERLHCDGEAIPPLQALDPETCYLHSEITLLHHDAQSLVDTAFGFVRDDATIGLVRAPKVDEVASDAAEAVVPNPQEPPPSKDLAAPNSAPSKGDRAPIEAQRYVRVRAERLDQLIDLLGELVISTASATLLAREDGQAPLVEANQQVSGLVEEVRNGTLQLRMVPIGDTFARFRRVVRDTAEELGKEISLELEGTDTELDKSVVEQIVDPLMHLVRNALDHGLEAPEARVEAGKSREGRLTLSACHDSGNILIRIIDDGRGIDLEKVRARGLERGLINPDSEPSDKEILNLIFEAGFSTAPEVTNLSGRGVGMDVVRRNIEALRGSVSLQSTAGQGTCFEIRLPLTLAIIDGFLVGVGGSRFIFPLDGVIEVIEGANTLAKSVSDRGQVIELRGQLLPVIDLRQLYGLGGCASARHSVVVVRSGDAQLGVLVDALLGQHQTVIKPLSRIFSGLRGVSGSTILGNGGVALILDIAGLNAIASGPSSPTRLELRKSA